MPAGRPRASSLLREGAIGLDCIFFYACDHRQLHFFIRLSLRFLHNHHRWSPDSFHPPRSGDLRQVASLRPCIVPRTPYICSSVGLHRTGSQARMPTLQLEREKKSFRFEFLNLTCIPSLRAPLFTTSARELQHLPAPVAAYKTSDPFVFQPQTRPRLLATIKSHGYPRTQPMSCRPTRHAQSMLDVISHWDLRSHND